MMKKVAALLTISLLVTGMAWAQGFSVGPGGLSPHPLTTQFVKAWGQLERDMSIGEVIQLLGRDWWTNSAMPSIGMDGVAWVPATGQLCWLRKHGYRENLHFDVEFTYDTDKRSWRTVSKSVEWVFWKYPELVEYGVTEQVRIDMTRNYEALASRLTDSEER